MNRVRTLLVLPACAIAVLLIGWMLTVLLGAGAYSRDVVAISGADSMQARDMPGIYCEPRDLSVALVPDGFRRYDLHGELCWSGERPGSVLQVLVSGAGYGGLYWDFPYQADKYSYVLAAVRAGYTTFNFDRLGIGSSDHPFGLWLNVDNHAHVLSQLISTLAAEGDYAAVVTVGHSLGSVIAMAHALSHPGQVDGIVLTGYAHNTNPGFAEAMRTGVDLAAMRRPFAGRLFDPTYVIASPGIRRQMFYVAENTDPAVIETDELNGETTTIGEVISMPEYFGSQSLELQVPVLGIVGDQDFLVCGGEVNCRDHSRFVAREQQFYPGEAQMQLEVIPGTGHNANLHRNAPEVFAIMLDYIGRMTAL